MVIEAPARVAFFLLPVINNHGYLENQTPNKTFKKIDPLQYMYDIIYIYLKTKITIYLPVFHAFVAESLLVEFFQNSILAEKHMKYLAPCEIVVYS